MQNDIYFGLDLISNDGLEHIGMPKRSGRYPWGSGEDPYHHGADAPGGKKKRFSLGDSLKKAAKNYAEADKKAQSDYDSRISKIKERARQKKLAKEEKKQAMKAEEERLAKEKYEEEKKAAIGSGDPKQLAPYVDDLTDNELRAACNRIRLENEFKDLYAKANPKGKSAVEKINDGLTTLNKYASTGINTWNNFAKIHNAFSSEEDKLPTIGDGNKKKEGKKKKNENNDNNNSSDSGKPAGGNSKSTKDSKSKPTDVTDVKLVDDRKVLEEAFKELSTRPSSVELNAPYHATYSTGKQSNTASVYSLYNTPIAKRKKVPRLKR